MQIAYLILAEKRPHHLRKLVKALSTSNATFFIHVDKKSNNIADFTMHDKNVFFTKNRVPVYWGDFSMVQATLVLLRQALNSDYDFDYFVLLSESDFPLRSSLYIENFLKNNHGKEFINFIHMSSKKAGKPISRLSCYKPQACRYITTLLYRMIKKGLSILKLDSILNRNYPKIFGNLIPYAGSQWWALTQDASAYILDFVDNNKNIIKYFENTHIPDEMFFQTILGNSPFKSHIHRNFTFTDWATDAKSPNTITMEHILYFESYPQVIRDDVYGKGELLFARKFPDNSGKIISKIEKMINKKEHYFSFPVSYPESIPHEDANQHINF